MLLDSYNVVSMIEIFRTKLQICSNMYIYNLIHMRI